MSNLKKMLQGSELPITMRMERWLTTNSNATYSAKALKFAQLALSNQVGGSRARRNPLRSSSTGQCRRRQVLRAAGHPEDTEISSRVANIFHTGNMLHLKWQMAGLTEGWLAEAEVPKDRDDLLFGGTLDGILWQGSGLEFKSINNRGYTMVQSARAPREDHIRQVHGYFVLDEKIKNFSVVYENKDNGEWREYVVERDEDLIDEILIELKELKAYLEDKILPPIKPKCLEREGMEYRSCPFKDSCLTMKRWPGSA